MRALPLTLLVVSLPATPALAQQASYGVPTGARVRVTSEVLRVERWITRLESTSGDTMFFAQREGQPFAVPVRHISRLEVSEGLGRSRGLKALHVGLAYAGGVVGGGLIGAAIGADADESVKGSLILGVFTAVVGYGEPAFGRGERWRRVSLIQPDVGLMPLPGGGLAVGVRVTLH